MGGRESFREEGKEELAKSDWGFGISEKEKGSFASETGRSGGLGKTWFVDFRPNVLSLRHQGDSLE